MSELDKELALQWLEKARHDLFTAPRVLDAEDGPTDTPCFHAQQTAEKTLKAILTAAGVRFCPWGALSRESQRMTRYSHEPWSGSHRAVREPRPAAMFPPISIRRASNPGTVLSRGSNPRCPDFLPPGGRIPHVRPNSAMRARSGLNGGCNPLRVPRSLPPKAA